jgi:hypothetical protein
MKRDFPEVWRALKKGWSPDLLKVEINGNRISKLVETAATGEMSGDS